MGISAHSSLVEGINTCYLETLLGYSVRRTVLVIVEVFIERMAIYDLRVVEFSVLSLVLHNPGITSRLLCRSLGIQAPNVVRTVNFLESRALIERRQHPSDKRSIGLFATHAAMKLMQMAEKTVLQLELDTTVSLSTEERKVLRKLLKKIYKS
jgi:DNA-binding MarR family transcriptional regulator